MGGNCFQMPSGCCRPAYRYSKTRDVFILISSFTVACKCIEMLTMKIDILHQVELILLWFISNPAQMTKMCHAKLAANAYTGCRATLHNHFMLAY